MKLHIFDKREILLEVYADFVMTNVNSSIEKQGYCNLVLAGGNSPKPVYEKIASAPSKNKVDWRKVFFFIGDERYVPADDPEYNGFMLDQTLFQPLKIAKDHIFMVDTSNPPEDAARQYLETIKIHFQNKPICFDLVLLGLGDDAHTASLFPFTKILSADHPSVEAVYLESIGVYRISMTAPMINMARQIAYLVYGAKKALAVKNVIQGQTKPNTYPAQLIKPFKGNLDWFLDKEAAAYLHTQK